jgi:hypothetical protein
MPVKHISYHLVMDEYLVLSYHSSSSITTAYLIVSKRVYYIKRVIRYECHLNNDMYY